MIFYALLVLVGSIIAGRLILGELRKEYRDYVVIEQKEIYPPELVPVEIKISAVKENISGAITQSETPKPQEKIISVSKLEQLLTEKNAELVKLQNILEAERRHQVEFEKIKALLERQIFEARQMNREVKKELDALMNQGEQFQKEALHLKTELNYKEQLLNKNELKISELKNRIQNLLSASPDPSKPDESYPKSNFNLGDISFEEFDWRKKLEE